MMFAQQVEKALSKVEKDLHIETLKRAATTPLIEGRSIGSDILDEARIHNPSTKKDKDDAINKIRSPDKILHLNQTAVNSSSKMDFQTINSSILLREAEENRKRTMRQKVLEMQEKHMTQIQETLKPIEEQSQLEKRQWVERRIHNDSQIIAKAEQQSLLELKEDERILDDLRLQTQKQLRLVSFQGIIQYQSKFRCKYESIVQLLMSVDKSALISYNEYNRKLKELILMFEQLINKIKCGECGPTEMKTAENLCRSLACLEVSIMEAKQEKERHENEIKEHQRKEREAAIVIAEVAAQQQASQQNEAQERQSNQTTEEHQVLKDKVDTENEMRSKTSTETTTISPKYVSQERLEFYTKINSFYQEKVERVKALQSDDSMKKYRFECQKSINIPVNAISAVSPQHIQDKFDKLYSFVTSQPPLGRDYCILLMAKKFVGQGETTISSNPQAAFPVASVIVSLWKQIPEFGQLFLAYCFKECPFLVPYFIPQRKDQTPEEYSKILGFRTVDGQPEKQDMYLKRQSGIARLYAALMITNGRQQDGPLHPYGLENAWRWLANMVDIAPLPQISATLIVEILLIVGSDLRSCYGRQFVKLLIYIQQFYFPTLLEEEGGPKARLELLLHNFLRDGQIQRPGGMLPAGFW